MGKGLDWKWDSHELTEGDAGREETGGATRACAARSTRSTRSEVFQTDQHGITENRTSENASSGAINPHQPASRSHQSAFFLSPA